MTYLNGSDAANPDGALPGQVVMFYIGGEADHVWTIDQVKAQRAEYLIPVWVAGYTVSAADQGKACVDALYDYNIPEGVAYVLDAELLNQGDNDWVDAFANETAAEHYGCHIYDSKSRIFHFQPRSGYIVADWTGVRHMYEHPWVKGTQWENDPEYDLDVFDSELRMWRNPYVR